MDCKRKSFSTLSSRQKRRIILQEIKEINSVPSFVDIVDVSTTENRTYLDVCTSNSLQIDNIQLESESFIGNHNHCVNRKLIVTNSDKTNLINYDSSVDYSSTACLKAELQQVVIKHNLTHMAITDILHVLKKYGNNDLPYDSRTLLKTPRNICTDIVPVNPGRYIHFGLSHTIIRMIPKHFTVIPDQVLLNFNIDGLPISKSSTLQFWPILASFVLHENNLYTEPFAVGIYEGNMKPHDANEYLKQLIDDIKIIMDNNNYIDVDNKKVKVIINLFICDAPAKAFITGIKNHSGYNSCSKCTVHGDYIDNRVVFLESNCDFRTDLSFLQKADPDHHKFTSVLELLNIGMVSNFVIDYMHLVCLGIMKRLLQFWVKGAKNFRLNDTQLKEVDEELLAHKTWIPTEFARKPRSISEIDRWKATELRQFLLYTGPIVLQSKLSSSFYIHFLSLSIAIRILTDKDLSLKLNDYAHSLLLYFVKKMSNLYGNKYVSYNVHNLIHLAAQVKQHGTLDSCSSFKYENYMYKLKKSLKPGSRQLEQIANRLAESFNSEAVISKKNNPNTSVLYRNNVIYAVKYLSFCLTVDFPNNCCVLNNRDIVIIQNILSINGKLVIKAIKCDTMNSLYSTPCDSFELGIAVVSFKNKCLIDIYANDIKRKCFIVKKRHPDYIVVPFLHENI